MTHEPVSSSYIESTAYDSQAQVMQVRFRNGAVSSFEGVTPEMHAALRAAKSVGKYFREHVHGKVTHTLVTPAPNAGGDRRRPLPKALTKRGRP
jgi:hypothetical protein